MKKIDVKPILENELVLCRLIDAPPEKVYRAFTEPKLLKEWFAPKPYTIERAEIDVRPGGNSFLVMKSPDGQEIPLPGVYLEVVPNKKIVTTDAFTKAWEPSAKPFMTAVLTFENVDGKTKYTARALHWNKEDHDTHLKMGFHEGWGQCADQLEELLKKL